MSNTVINNTARGGAPWAIILTVVLAIVKLIWEPAALTWLWVFAPMWVPLAIIAALLIGAGAIALTVLGLSKFTSPNKKKRR